MGRRCQGSISGFEHESLSMIVRMRARGALRPRSPGRQASGPGMRGHPLHHPEENRKQRRCQAEAIRHCARRSLAPFGEQPEPEDDSRGMKGFGPGPAPAGRLWLCLRRRAEFSTAGGIPARARKEHPFAALRRGIGHDLGGHRSRRISGRSALSCGLSFKQPGVFSESQRDVRGRVCGAAGRAKGSRPNPDPPHESDRTGGDRPAMWSRAGR